MDYTKEFLARLQNGESVEDIAAELTKSINTANEKYEAEQEAKRKAEQEALNKSAEHTNKCDAVEDFLAGLFSVLDAWGINDPSIIAEVENTDVEEFVEVLDQSIPIITNYVELNKRLRNLVPPEVKQTENKPITEAAKKMAETDPIESFLNSFVRIK